jgi:putative chitinase
VSAGDSFESIANKYGVTVRELVGANPQLLRTGEQLTVPVAVAIPSDNGGGTGSGPRTHTVKAGENLTIIAIKYGTTVAAIAAANNIVNINSLSVGQVLTIP